MSLLLLLNPAKQPAQRGITGSLLLCRPLGGARSAAPKGQGPDYPTIPAFIGGTITSSADGTGSPTGSSPLIAIAGSSAGQFYGEGLITAGVGLAGKGSTKSRGTTFVGALAAILRARGTIESKGRALGKVVSSLFAKGATRATVRPGLAPRTLLLGRSATTSKGHAGIGVRLLLAARATTGSKAKTLGTVALHLAAYIRGKGKGRALQGDVASLTGRVATKVAGLAGSGAQALGGVWSGFAANMSRLMTRKGS